MDGFQHVVKKDRMRLSRVRSPQDNQVGLFHLFIRAGAAPCAKDCRQTGDARRVSSAIATINVIAANHQPGELLGHEIRLVRSFRTAKESKRSRSMLLYGALKSCGSARQRLIPRDRTELTVITDERFGETNIRTFHIRAFLTYRKQFVPDVYTR